MEAAARPGSVVADLPINPRATTLLGRRWDAAAQKAGPV